MLKADRIFHVSLPSSCRGDQQEERVGSYFFPSLPPVYLEAVQPLVSEYSYRGETLLYSMFKFYAPIQPLFLLTSVSFSFFCLFVSLYITLLDLMSNETKL